MIFLFLFDSADIIVVLTYFIRYIDAVLNRKSYKCVVTFCVEFHCFRSLFLAPDRSVSLLLALSRFFCSFFWSFSWRLVSYNLPSCSFFISPLWSSESWMLWRNTPSVIHSTRISFRSIDRLRVSRNPYNSRHLWTKTSFQDHVNVPLLFTLPS